MDVVKEPPAHFDGVPVRTQPLLAHEAFNVESVGCLEQGMGKQKQMQLD
jgi:hypothetical protein